MERKIGEKFTQNSSTIKVVKGDGDSCKGCFYDKGALSYICWFKETLDNRGECRQYNRENKDGIIFKETFLSRNINPITYTSVIVVSGLIWYFAFKFIFGL